ncbi:hypothetical protein Hs30E_11370 [Lactococcus hodotermopsidis]|uniref:VWFA domain-containing protein n=1 Tax=Pseudolactococcus hodotermopsidis TaxID=2709157 RepID=A0A6A0BCL4_9LACT|nr:VWA domain-containing protein [Lactococcus hodotermopsidis]GFH42586.1 hypothetical protein Hs30E_11370 [Lactococcus hodotermopsidis]
MKKLSQKTKLKLLLFSTAAVVLTSQTVFAENGLEWDSYVTSHQDEVSQVQAENDKQAKITSQKIDVNFGMKETRSQSKKYTVLVIDDSASMAGTPMDKTKAAASKFIEQMLQSSGENYISIVAFSDTDKTVTDFTNDKNVLDKAVGELKAQGQTDMTAGLSKASQLLKNNANLSGVTNNVVLLSDGETDDEATALNQVKEISKSANVYSLGFFQSLSGDYLLDARNFMMETQNAGYYDVTNADELNFNFAPLAEEVSGITGNFKFSSLDAAYKGTKDNEQSYFYSDDYFTKSPTVYNEHLATMSLNLAIAGFASDDTDDYAKKSQNAQKLLAETGFKDIIVNESFLNKPTKDSIGVIAGQKRVVENGQPYTLIAVAVRGGGYESEWSSNGNVGQAGNHAGFEQAKNEVLSFINEAYMKDKSSNEKVKIWLTGYSRAGATVDMAAGALNEGYQFDSVDNTRLTIPQENIYAYAFETPNGYLPQNKKTPKYKNIWNTINRADIVPKLAPDAWGFTHYGNENTISATIFSNIFTKQKNKMLARFTEIAPNTKYIVNTFGEMPIFVLSQEAYFDSVVKGVSKDVIKNRQNYFTNYQNAFSNMAANYLGGDSSATLTDDETLKVTLAGVHAFVRHPILTVAFPEMVDNLAQAHYPELALAWAQSQDSYYTPDGQPNFVSGNYRIVRVNCPVNVEVYNENNEKVGEIVNDVPQGEVLAMGLNDDGEKIIYLPPDGDYTFKTIATDDGEMSISINEYSAEEGDINRVQNYYDLPLELGKAYTSKIPAYTEAADSDGGTENGSGTPYEVKNDTTGETLTPDLSIAGEEVANQKYQIDVFSENEAQGEVSGSGQQLVGSFSKIVATPSENYEFAGWYENDKLISDKSDYRFRVKANRKIIAKFKSTKEKETTKVEAKLTKVTPSSSNKIDGLSATAIKQKSVNQIAKNQNHTFAILAVVAVSVAGVALTLFKRHRKAVWLKTLL